MVHITDTRAQKVVSYTSAHITETVFAHDQRWEEQIALSSPQLYRHSQEHRKWITIQQRITQPVLVRVQPWEAQKTFPALLTFFCLVCVYTVQCPHIFTTQKQYWWESNTETIHGQLLHLVSTIQERWIIEEKWRFVKSIRHLKHSNKKVGWRCVSYKKSIQVVSQHGIKGPDTMANLVWANTNISGYVMPNSVGIVICST